MNRPEHTNPLIYSDYPSPQSVTCENGKTQLLLDLTARRTALLQLFAAHVTETEQTYGKLDTNDDDSYCKAASQLEKLIGQDIPVLGLAKGDQAQITGADYFIYQNSLHKVEQDSRLTGRYIDYAVNPHYSLRGRGIEEPSEILPAALYLAFDSLVELPADKGPETEYPIGPGSFALVSLQNFDLQLSKVKTISFRALTEPPKLG